MPLPTATIRNQVSVPLRFEDGYSTAARVFSFDGLVDGQEHLAFGLGNWTAPVASAGNAPVPLVSSTPTRCRTRDSTPMRRTSRWATGRTSAAYLATKARKGAHMLDLPLTAR